MTFLPTVCIIVLYYIIYYILYIASIILKLDKTTWKYCKYVLSRRRVHALNILRYILSASGLGLICASRCVLHRYNQGNSITRLSHIGLSDRQKDKITAIISAFKNNNDSLI